MISTKVVVCVTLGLFAVAIGAAWTAARRGKAVESERAAWADRCARVGIDLRQAEQRLALAVAHRAKYQAEVDGMLAKKVGPLVTDSSPAKSRRAAHRAAFVERMRNEPATQVLWLATRRAQLAALYEPLWRTLNLSVAQQEAFQTAMIRHDETEMDLRAVEETQGISPQDPAVERLRQQAASEHEAALLSMLGVDGYEQLKGYNRTTNARQMVNGMVGGAVVMGRAPFSAAQGEQLIEIIANTSESYRHGSMANMNEIDWEAVDAQARHILSEEQFAAFKSMEPPLPVGGRHQARLYRLIEEAKRSDATASGK